MGLMPTNPLQDAGLLCERVKRAGLDVRHCEIGPKGPYVELNSPTRENLATLADVLRTHDVDAVKAVQAELNMDRPITRREVMALIQQLRDELKEIRNAR